MTELVSIASARTCHHISATMPLKSNKLLPLAKETKSRAPQGPLDIAQISQSLNQALIDMLRPSRLKSPRHLVGKIIKLRRYRLK